MLLRSQADNPARREARRLEKLTLVNGIVECGLERGEAERMVDVAFHATEEAQLTIMRIINAAGFDAQQMLTTLTVVSLSMECVMKALGDEINGVVGADVCQCAECQRRRATMGAGHGHTH